MLRRFLATLFSSWLINPLGILVAHILGVTSDPTLVFILLAVGACVPFQIYLNESIAVRMAAGNTPSAIRLLVLVLVTQAMACVIALFFLAAEEIHASQIWAVVAATLMTSVLSFLYSRSYFRLVAQGGMSVRQAALFGFMPGMVTMALYGLASLAREHWYDLFFLILLSTIVLPTVIGYAYVLKLDSLHAIQPAVALPVATLPTETGSIAVLLGLVALTFCATLLRGEISGANEKFAAIIVFALNSLASLMTTVTRALFLSKTRQPRPSVLPVLGIVSGVAALALIEYSPLLASLFWLTATQTILIALIEVGRRSGAAARPL